jgi:hypothetical protein
MYSFVSAVFALRSALESRLIGRKGQPKKFYRELSTTRNLGAEEDERDPFYSGRDGARLSHQR